jgi:DNA helicase II / ATP-dependent DNA helicase PcrA
MQFTRDQLDAINHDKGNLQLIACAGSGKTEVVARRIANLVKNGALPASIIAFTFTDKAAAELKDRIVTRCRDLVGDINGLAEMYVGTIHAFCLDLLMTEVHDVLKFNVLNEVQQTLFIDRHSKTSGLTTCRDIKGVLLKRYRDTANYLSALNTLREDEPDPTLLQKTHLPQTLATYRGLLNERRYLDYSEILTRALAELRENNTLRQHLSHRVRYLVVDEYQDVNPIQEAIVKALYELGAELCVVGDDDQTIYQWRGSDVNNILQFEHRYPNVSQIRLEDNFRSSEGIIETAREFIEQNSIRLPKQMRPAKAQNYESGDICALQFDDVDGEAAYIAHTAKELYGVAFKEPTTDDSERTRGLAWSDMAILLRSVARNGAPILEALAKNDIPHVVLGMNTLFETKEAIAARELFYFMAHRPHSDRHTVRNAWQSSDLSLEAANLENALADAEKARDSMETPTERYGVYSVQRSFLRFIEVAGVREERISSDRAEIVLYNLGKFSQLISDFETIHYHSQPKEKYESFADFLEYRAANAYPEGWQSNQYANPNAVRIMTVHQAKGMQWPIVFVPALIKNRFPAAAQGGRNQWHIIQPALISKQARFRGSIEDERRLFYVALTRSQKFLHLTYAPVAGNQKFQRVSEFLTDIYRSKFVKRRTPDYSGRKRSEPQARKGVTNVVFTFSDIKYFFECPYQFKLRILYGFNAPIHEALGYGRSLHNALAEVHQRAMDGDFATSAEAVDLATRHLHTPYAYKKLQQELDQAARRVLTDYINDNAADLKNIEFSEKQIEITLNDGVSVVGRIDLVRRIDTGETTIVDLKSSERAQAEDVTETQLHVYALGYRELTGRDADQVEIYELDERKRKPRSVDEEFIKDVEVQVAGAAAALRSGVLSPTPTAKKCMACDYLKMCGAGLKAIS